MDKSRSYYRLVYKRFGHKEVRLQQADHEELGGEADSATITAKEDNELTIMQSLLEIEEMQRLYWSFTRILLISISKQLGKSSLKQWRNMLLLLLSLWYLL